MNIVFIVKENIYFLTKRLYTPPPFPQVCEPLNVVWLTKFEHIVQSLSNTCLLDVRS
jgi:hypothetical protein